MSLLQRSYIRFHHSFDSFQRINECVLFRPSELTLIGEFGNCVINDVKRRRIIGATGPFVTASDPCFIDESLKKLAAMHWFPGQEMAAIMHDRLLKLPFHNLN